MPLASSAEQVRPKPGNKNHFSFNYFDQSSDMGYNVIQKHDLFAHCAYEFEEVVYQTRK